MRIAPGQGWRRMRPKSSMPSTCGSARLASTIPGHTRGNRSRASTWLTTLIDSSPGCSTSTCSRSRSKPALCGRVRGDAQAVAGVPPVPLDGGASPPIGRGSPRLPNERPVRRAPGPPRAGRQALSNDRGPPHPNDRRPDLPRARCRPRDAPAHWGYPSQLPAGWAIHRSRPGGTYAPQLFPAMHRFRSSARTCRERACGQRDRATQPRG